MRKRHRSPEQYISLSNKRAKRTDSPDDEVEEVDEPSEDSQYYPIRKVLDERGDKYKLEWDGIDPKTKKPWKPTWVRDLVLDETCFEGHKKSFL